MCIERVPKEKLSPVLLSIITHIECECTAGGQAN